ncbi:hypothetical protein B296_00017292 [Ensete ventricosum]|uniref:Uncharacterized protein n=1 Tax=Ensete ventricosum TaxID=4639 RepID=A0A427AW21_ENSVE|nr:hypothetical protein B296_00017292 [Ensete ventricosum]
MSSSEKHSYTCFDKVGCRAPSKYSPDNGPSVQNGQDLEMVDHLGTKRSSPSTHFSRVMIEAKYLSALAQSSTSHNSFMVYPRSGTSPSSIVPLPLSVKVLVVFLEASIGCSVAGFQRHFLKPTSALKLGCFSTVDTPASPTAGTLAVDGATELLPAPPLDFILPRLNTSAQQKSILKKDRIVAKASAVPKSPRALIDGTTATDMESPKG